MVYGIQADKQLFGNLNKHKTGNVPHHLPEAPCQQVRALIDERLPNCPVINEWLHSLPSVLLILTLFICFWEDTAGPNVTAWHFHLSLFSASLMLHEDF